jgi:hypothetical protein
MTKYFKVSWKHKEVKGPVPCGTVLKFESRSPVKHMTDADAHKVSKVFTDAGHHAPGMELVTGLAGRKPVNLGDIPSRRMGR